MAICAQPPTCCEDTTCYHKMYTEGEDWDPRHFTWLIIQQYNTAHPGERAPPLHVFGWQSLPEMLMLPLKAVKKGHCLHNSRSGCNVVWYNIKWIRRPTERSRAKEEGHLSLYWCQTSIYCNVSFYFLLALFVCFYQSSCISQCKCVLSFMSIQEPRLLDQNAIKEGWRNLLPFITPLLPCYYSAHKYQALPIKSLTTQLFSQCT